MIFFRRQGGDTPAESSDAAGQAGQAGQTGGQSGQPGQPVQADPTGLRAKCAAADLPDAVRGVLDAEIGRMEKTDAAAPENAIALNYVECLLDLPWNGLTRDSLDLARAAAVFDASHAGLGQVRERVLEHLAARVLCATQPAAVLVVDDEPIARDNVAHVLAREGYTVDTAANGEEALARLAQRSYDSIVTDLKMDRMDGMQLIEAARRVAPDTRIVVVTGYATVDTAVQALKTGAVQYLSKPIDIAELRATVREALADRTQGLSSRAPVLCFTGPPGVGKTSVGRALAEALGRRFYRMSLADLRDEAELRGHRRTYVGAMPGRIIQALRATGVRNPVFMLDEIDKVGQDAKGDPAMALLEVLDPEQNARFVDRYLEIPFDLSQVLFIATANGVERLRGPLLDRMEVVEFHGYAEADKLDIATRFLLPRQLREHGLTAPYPQVTPGALARIINDYTSEAGVRGLERELARLCRKLARLRLEAGGHAGGAGTSGHTEPAGATNPASGIAPGTAAPEPQPPNTLLVDDAVAAVLLGPPRYRHDAAHGAPRVGTATGLVWSEAGGEIVFVEAARMAGSGQLILTGSLGEVLKESARIALSHIRAEAEHLGVSALSGQADEGHSGQPGQDDTPPQDIHIHIPAGGIAKDGPSAGLTICVALVSLLSGRPARADVALSGELSLSGRVLPVSGVREKLLAAARAGARTVVLPAANEPETRGLLAEFAARGSGGLPQVAFAARVQDALAVALLPAKQEGGAEGGPAGNEGGAPCSS
ncbi:S16 family serine protease [Nitratidesulfovibrio liaohensis]|uniref:endopeptidase La n=1 Tax=Nitratidesulfovibrio liaohensis TaxID=2604158 RepID=A0ABY9QYB7_9BACT|nr:S16 family serine protease [Nitratidesulfovibrio liaohensis]WMW64337.1 response regulator [Nitratidesulfovibrio liaohensis]